MKLKEYSMEKLDIPSIKVKRSPRRASDTSFSSIVVRVKRTDPVTKEEKESVIVVGRVENDQEFGRIIFKESFLEQYPQLRNVTVKRKGVGKFVWVKAAPPFEKNEYEKSCLKRGRKKYDPEAPEPQTKKQQTPRATVKTKHVGNTYVLMEIAKDLGIDKILEQLSNPKKAKQTLSLAIQRIRKCETDRAAEYDWHSTLFPYDGCISGSTRTALYKEWSSRELRINFCKLLFNHISKKQPQDNNILGLIIDGSSISTYSKNIQNAAFGHNKDLERLPQVNVMFATLADSGVPVAMRMYGGEVPDVTACEYFANMCKTISCESTKKPMIIADRGFPSVKNLCVFIDLGFLFLCKLPTGKKGSFGYDAIAEAERNGIRNSQNYNYTCNCFVKEVSCISVQTTFHDDSIRVFVYYNRDRALEEHSAIFKAVLESLLEAQKCPKTKLSEKTKMMLKKGFIVCASNGTYTFNDTAIREAAENKAFSVLITNSKELTVTQAYEYYSKRNNCEVAFRVTKDYLGHRRLRSSGDDTAEGSLFVTFIATIIYSALLDRCRRAKQMLIDNNESLSPYVRYLESVPELLSFMHRIKVDMSGDNPVYYEICGKTAKLLKILQIPLPAGNLVSGDSDCLSDETSDVYTLDNIYEDNLRLL